MERQSDDRPPDAAQAQPTERLAQDLLGRVADTGAFGSGPAVPSDLGAVQPTILGTQTGIPGAREGPRAVTPDAPTLRTPQSEWCWPNVPQRLGAYDLVGELGHGGMGIVFRAQHLKLGNECAVKVLIAGEHASPEAIARFQREAAAVARMGKHPNIVTVHDLGQEGTLSYYAMELVEGESLRRRLVERPCTPREAAALVEKVASALHFAHGHGVIHRDIKPDNIVVRADGEPQVMDFGLARDLDSGSQLSAVGQVMGTPAYMAPEQVRGDVSETDARTDVYALGAVLYEMLTGTPPHGGHDLGIIFAQVLSGDVVAPRRLRPEVPRDLETVCLKCLELSPSKRYPSAEGLADDLARFQRGEPVQARPVGRAERGLRWVRRNPVPSALAALVLVSLFGGIGLAEWRASSQRTAEYQRLVADADTRLARLPGDRDEAIRELVTIDERLRAAQELMAAHGGGPLARRYQVNRCLGDLALEGQDYLLSRLAFSVCRSVDATRADAEGLDRKVEEAEQREAQRRKERIQMALDDISKWLGRPGRELGAPDLEDYVFEVSGYRDEQTVGLLREALQPLREKGRREGKKTLWTQEERDLMAFAFHVLGRLGLESAVGPLGGMMGVLWDHSLAVECGTALCNTRQVGASGPLWGANLRFGVNSPTWRAIEHSFDRIPSAALRPGHVDEFILRGLARQAKGDADGAIEDFTRAIHLDPTNGATFCNRGNARLAKRDLVGAVQDFDRTIELDANCDAGYTGRGRVAQERGDVDGAIRDFTRAIELNPEDPIAFSNRGNSRTAKGDAIGAIDDFGRAIELDANSAAPFIGRGLARMKRGDVAGAIEDYDRAISLDPKSPDAFVNRGNARTAKSDLDGAIEDYDRAIEFDPRNAAAFNNRGLARQDKGDVDGALGDFNRAISLNPEDAGAHYNRGAVRVAKGDVGGAIEDCTRAIQLDPSSANAYLNRGHARTAMEDYVGAIEDYNRALAIDAKMAEALSARGAARHVNGDLDGAIQDYTHSLQLTPDEARVLARRAVAFQAKGEVAGASEDWERFLELAVKNSIATQNGFTCADAHYNLACLSSLASAGKSRADARPEPVNTAEALRLRDDAFKHLREAVELGFADEKQIRADTDLSPLYADPRWGELLKRLSK